MHKGKDIILIAILSTVVPIVIAFSQNVSALSRLGTPGIKTSDQEDHRHGRPSPERIYRFNEQVVTVSDFEAEGYILAIGGGGEGIIGQLKGQQVVAIDISKRELEGTPPGPLKIVMDARDLKFLNGAFNTAASFFTLCYIDGADHEEVFEEIFRVLARGGRFLIWDAVFPEREDEKKDVAIIPLLVKLPDKEIATGYGVNWPDKARDLPYYMKLAENAGFKVGASAKKDQWFFLDLKKP
ncbi:MAG: methyltransferase domain-containing protein [Candidatus Latescibacteria bacterium]|nr:methyltransferase domain-containing protein [Candidatus Latescibacterota bacterium]NIO27117.1 methyltransferase domain-containing protein [Candidatus Latescibacterota bacterium]NIO54641.1 methyltransferase domain-containing protein [Candidatus Latescibacterota bacterium]NIT00724.1 methyltransferase domain-containing protein [Candidatus Latescibacterota bacterium]NIT37647.1 methyltransferase domain-containing protein [Candidatus Latescibacterota bacterium]